MDTSRNMGDRNRLHPLFEKDQKQPSNLVFNFTGKDYIQWRRERWFSGAIPRGTAFFLGLGGPRPIVMIFFLSVKPSTKIFVNS